MRNTIRHLAFDSYLPMPSWLNYSRFWARLTPYWPLCTVSGRAEIHRALRGSTQFVGEFLLAGVCVALVVRDRADGITLDQCDAHGLPPKVRYTRIKGILTIELRVKSHSIELWRGRVQLMKAKGAPWRRVHSLGTIFDQEGHILIDGWYDELLPPDEDVLLNY